MLLPLITGAIGLVFIYKNRPSLSLSTMVWLWSRISTKIGSNSKLHPHFKVEHDWIFEIWFLITVYVCIMS